MPAMAEDDAAGHSWLRPVGEGERVVPHGPRCMGCGPNATAGYHLEAYRRGDAVVASFLFGPEHEGAPGLAHGGAVAAVCDDLLGHVLTGLGIPAVTRNLQVDYLRPVLLGERHDIAARLESVDGRKVWIGCEAKAPDGQRRFSARGLFIKVGLEHFLAGLSEDERERAKAQIEKLRAAGRDVSAW